MKAASNVKRDGVSHCSKNSHPGAILVSQDSQEKLPGVGLGVFW